MRLIGSVSAITLVALLATGCADETLNVGDPNAAPGVGDTTPGPASNGTSGGTAGPTTGTTPGMTGDVGTFERRTLSPVDEFREAGYIRRSRPKGLELSPDGATLYVTLEGNLVEPGNEVLALGAATGQTLARITVGSSPQGMALSQDGSKLYVANQFSNFISVIDLVSNSVVGEIEVAFYAQDLAVSADGQTLYITNRWLDALEVVTLAAPNGVAGQVTARVDVGTNPRDVVVADDGQVYVGNLSATSVSVVDPVRLVETSRVHTNSPVNGLAEGMGFVFLATLGVGDGHPKTTGLNDGAAFRGDSTASLGFADINNDIVVLNAANAGVLYRYTSDTAEVSHADAQGDYSDAQMIVEGALPEQVTVSGNNIFVVMSASDQVQQLTVDPITGALTPVRAFDTGINPFEAVVSSDGRTLFTADRLGDTISSIDIATNIRTEFNVGTSPQPYPANDYEVGEQLFHTARFSSEALPSEVFPGGTKAGDKSCNHCHRETLTDGKVWTVGPDVLIPLGGERMPPAARNIRDTLPLFWEGVQTEEDFDLESGEFAPLEDFEGETEEDLEHSRDEFFLEQVGLTFEQVGRQRIGEFLIGRPRLLPNPLAQFPTTEQAAAIERGRALFFSPQVQCGNCHPDGGPMQPFTTNNTIEPVISGSPLDNRGYLVQPFEIDGYFNIPSIRGVWDRPRVYFHDGRAKSIRSAILGDGHPALIPGEDGCHMLAEEQENFVAGVFRPIYNGDGCNETNGIPNTHGVTSALTPSEVDDLLMYVLSIE